MKYDDASWHSGNKFPETSPDKFGGTHIALFLKWCFIKGWAGEIHIDEELDDVKKVINGEISATKFFFKYCDGKLTDEDFNKEGNNFAELYYGKNGLYLNDYSNLFYDLMYKEPEENHNYTKLANYIEQRYKSNILTEDQLKAIKPWWKFW